MCLLSAAPAAPLRHTGRFYCEMITDRNTQVYFNLNLALNSNQNCLLLLWVDAH